MNQFSNNTNAGKNERILPLLGDVWYWQGARSINHKTALHRLKIIAIDDDSLVAEVLDIHKYDNTEPQKIYLLIDDFLNTATWVPPRKTLIQKIIGFFLS